MKVELDELKVGAKYRITWEGAKSRKYVTHGEFLRTEFSMGFIFTWFRIEYENEEPLDNPMTWNDLIDCEQVE